MWRGKASTYLKEEEKEKRGEGERREEERGRQRGRISLKSGAHVSRQHSPWSPCRPRDSESLVTFTGQSPGKLSRLHSHTDVSKPHGVFSAWSQHQLWNGSQRWLLAERVYSATLTHPRFTEAQDMSDLITEPQECFLRISTTNVIFVSEVLQTLQT